jgi:hypothetical protein
MSKQIPDFQNPIITVKSPSGEFLTVPKEGLQKALEQGFVIPSNDEIQYEINLRKEGESNLGALRAFGEAALGAATFGVSREIENKLGITNPAEQAFIKEAHPVAAGLGTGLGIIAPIAATAGTAAPAVAGAEAAGAAATAAGVAKAGVSAAELLNPVAAATKVGTAVSEAVAPRVAGALGSLAETSPRLAQAITQGAAGAAGLGVEGALYGVGNSIDEHALGDPEALGEHLLSNVGLSALMGGGLGAIFHGGMGLLKKPIAGKIEAGIPTAVDSLEASGQQIATLEDVIKNSSFDNPEQRKTLLSGLKQLKDHADEIFAAGEHFGVPVFPGQASASDDVQKVWQILSDSASPIGQAEKQSILNALKTIQGRMEQVVRASPTGSKAEVGQQIAQSLLDKSNAMIESYSAKFQELGLTESAIPVSERSIAQIARNIQKIPEVRGLGAPQFSQALEARLQGVKTLEDLTVQIKMLNNQIKTLSQPGGDLNAARIGGLVKDKLERLYEVTIKRQFSPKDQKYLLQMYKASRREFAQAAQKLGRIAGVTGKKNLGSPLNFVKMLTEEGKFNADTLVDKLFQKQNSKFLEFFQKEFPQEWEMVKNYQKGQFGEYKDGILNVNQIIRQYDKLEAEAQRALFNESERKTINFAKTYMDSFPAPINPSRTAPTLGWMAFLANPVEATYTTARDLAIKAGFGGLDISAKDAPRAATLSKVREYAQKTQRAVEFGSKAIFNPKTVRGVIGVGSQVLDQDEYHKIIDKVDKAVSNPEDFHSVLDKNTQNLNPYAPKTAFAIQNKMAVAASFLSAKAPRGLKTSVLSPKYQPSKSEINKFARYYNTVKSPTSVLKKIKTGSVLPEEMETLKVVYPQLLAEMQGSIMEQLAEHMANAKNLPYQTKLGLSAFLEHDLVNSMGQESVAMNQVTFGAPTMQQEQGLKPTQGGLGKLTANDRFQTGFKKLSAGGEA